MYRNPSLLAAVALTVACASSTGAPQPAQAPGVVSAPDAAMRPRPYPIFETRGFARAVEAGSRTRTGAPGPKYWQQWSRYRLAASYEPTTGLLEGQGTITYHNRSPDSLPMIYLHLHGNLFAPNAVRNRRVPVTDGVTLSRVAVRGQEVTPFSRSNARGYRVNGTIMALPLGTPLASGDSVALDFAWKLTVPADRAPRGGRDSTAAFVSYWYPQMAVFDDVNGWQIDPYLGNAEFYMGYGDYEVSLTVPSGYLIGATGTLQNADEVLSAPARDRLALAARSDTAVHVVAGADRGRATAGGQGGKVTWRFRATRVRDFAWGTSDRYNWDATRAATGNTAPDSGVSVIHSFWVPGEHRSGWADNARYGRFSIEFLSRFLWPYPYPQMTSIQGPASCGGMEYPMITCIGGAGWDSTSMFGVTVHEIGHMWFPMQVGSDEKRFGWMDEGLTQFNEGNGEKEFFKETESSTLSGARRIYMAAVQSGQDVEVMRHGDLYPSPGAFGSATYMKTAAILDALRGMLGEETFMRAYREYGRRWQWKHPQPFDLFNTFSAVSGRDLSWFWRSWAYETWTLDQAVGTVTQTPGSAEIVIEDKGLVPMPVPVTVSYENGRSEVLTVPVETWLGGARRATLRASGGTVTRVEIDAAKAFPDVDRANNVWPRP